MSAFETPLRPPKTPDYRPNLDEAMELTYTDPNLEPDPEDSPPASQLEPRHKAALAKQRSNEGLRLQKESRQKENLPRNTRSTRQPRKRKHEDTISAIQFKKQKTETSILKLERHLQQKTCPKSLQYKAKANVTPDETFRQEISAIKSHAEAQYVSALVRFHQRRLVSHKNKLEKANIAKSRSQYNVNTRERSRSPLRNIVNTDVDRIDKIENQLSELKDLIYNTLTDHQVSVLAKGLKFIETPVTNENKIRQQLLRDFEQFARRMRLRYIFHGNDKDSHPFHVKSNWIPPVQPSIALERYLENIKLSLAEIEITKPKHNLSYNEHKAVKELQNNTAINLKRADKGTTTVILNKRDKIQEAQVQLDNRDHYRPLENPMVTDTLKKVNELIAQLHNGKHIDDMTKKWLSQTPNPPRIPIFYTLTKIHKPLPVGRPIISGCEGPTERISSFVDHLLQPIAQKQKSYLKDTTDFINFIEKTQVSNDTILVSMDVTSLYTNIPQEEGITIVWQAYEKYHNNSPPIPSHYLKQMLGLILKENSFQFNGVNYLQCFGTAMGTRMAVAFANLFMAEIETKLLHQSSIKPTFSPCGMFVNKTLIYS
nr:uncharacterized protein LOC131771192 [Pocillopora verrucosa]